MSKYLFLGIILSFLFLIPSFHPSFALDQYSLTHFSTKGMITTDIIIDDQNVAETVLWTQMYDDKGTVVTSTANGITVFRFDIEENVNCPDSDTIVCLTGTVTEVKNTRYVKVGDKANLTFEMPDHQTITILSGALATLDIEIDLEKVQVKDTSKIAAKKFEEETELFFDEVWIRLQVGILLTEDPQIQKALLESNNEFQRLDEALQKIAERNEEWIAADAGEITPFMEALINSQTSEFLKKFIDFDKRNYEKYTYEEIFLVNAFGANVAQTGKTTDYEQWDEDWFQNAKLDGIDSHYGFDESAGVNSFDIALRVIDEQGRFLGVMKFVINTNELIQG